MVTARAAAATSARLICIALVLVAAGCSSLSALRGRDESPPSFTYHTPATGESIPAGGSVLVSADYSDCGRGVVPERVWFVVVPPRGEVLRFEEPSDFLNRSEDSATIMLRGPESKGLAPGVWTVNVYAEDRADNLATSTWTFRVTQ